MPRLYCCEYGVWYLSPIAVSAGGDKGTDNDPPVTLANVVFVIVTDCTDTGFALIGSSYRPGGGVSYEIPYPPRIAVRPDLNGSHEKPNRGAKFKLLSRAILLPYGEFLPASTCPLNGSPVF